MIFFFSVHTSRAYPCKTLLLSNPRTFGNTISFTIFAEFGKFETIVDVNCNAKWLKWRSSSLIKGAKFSNNGLIVSCNSVLLSWVLKNTLRVFNDDCLSCLFVY